MKDKVFKQLYPLLVSDYVGDRGIARSFFQFTPDEDGLKACADARDTGSFNTEISAILKRQNEKAGASEEAMNNINLLADKDTLAVMTGQQIGIMGGPLYVPLKIFKAVHAAEEMSVVLGRPVVPVFWLATSDHDFEEIDHVAVYDQSNDVSSLTWMEKHTANLSVGKMNVTAGLRMLLEQVCHELRETEHTESLRDFLLSSYEEGKSLAEVSMKFFAELFSSLGVIVFDPLDPEFRKLIRPILEKECKADSYSVFCKTAERISSAGYKVQVENEEGRINCFAEIEGVRTAIFCSDKGIVDREGNEVDISSVTLAPNVITRGICQDLVFPTLAYIGGPGELSYFALLKGIYEHHGMTMPVILPRFMGTLIEPRIKRKLKSLGTPAEEFLLNPKDVITSRLFEQDSGLDEGAVLNEMSKETDAFLESLERRLSTNGDNEIEGQIRKLSKNIKNQVKGIVGLVRRKEKQKSETVIRQAQEISEALLPDNSLQERKINLFYYMNLYGGKEFVHTLYGIVKDSGEGHNLWQI